MKKRILFIISNLQTGGVSKSMTSLLNVIDRNLYDVTLMLISPSGVFMELIPAGLRVITNPVWSALTGRFDGLWTLIKSGHPLLAFGHCIRLVVSKFDKAAAGRMIAVMMPGIDEEFDAIVDFNGQQQLYYMVDKLKAKKKLTFFHSDYRKWPYYYRADKKYFHDVHSIWSVSDECVNSLKEVFPKQAHKIFKMENISSLALIENLSEQFVPDEISGASASIITVGHVCENKGSHWAIEAASILKKKGIEFKWYFLGSNPDSTFYHNLCEKFDVQDRIEFLGIKSNPYPYIKAATIVVHPSKFEGRSIALDEAKLLCKPIVVTDFTTVTDQFTNRVNGSICNMDSQSIAKNVEELLTNGNLRNKYMTYLISERRDNSAEIEKLYKIFDE